MIDTNGIPKSACLLFWMIGLAPPGNAREGLAVAIFDQSGTPMQTLRAATAVASRIFHAAGIETEWTLCSTGPNDRCVLPPAKSYLTVMLVGRSMTGRKTGETLGLALAAKNPPADYCYVYGDSAMALAEDAAQPVSVVLACIMAHEIGHLQGLRHSRSGIMKGNFERRDILAAARDDLHFSAADARVLQAVTRH